MLALAGVVLWFLIIFSRHRVRLNDVRRALRWLAGEQPSFREVITGWWFANISVWAFAIVLHEKCSCEPDEFVRSLYRVVEFFRNCRDNFVSFRVFTELLEIRNQKFEDRNWAYFDAHQGVIFNSGVVRTISTMLQFSDADWRICDACLDYVRSDEIQSGLVKNKTADMLKEASAKLVEGAYSFRGKRPCLVKRLATYCHNLKMYAIRFGDEKAIVKFGMAEKSMKALGEREPDWKNGRKIDIAVCSAFAYLNDGSRAIYTTRCRMNATSVVIQQSAPPTRTEIAKAFFPGVDPALIKIMLKETYESDLKLERSEGFKEGVLAAFKHVNLKDLILGQFKAQRAEVVECVKKGVDESVVGKMNVSGQRRVPVRAAAQQLGLSRVTVNRWIQWFETDGEKGVECPVPNFSPILLESQAAFEAWKPTYFAWKATGKKDCEKREPKSEAAAIKQDHDDIEEIFAGYSRGSV